MKYKGSVMVLTTSFPVKDKIAVGLHIMEKCKHLMKKGWKVRVLAPSHYSSPNRENIDGIEVKRFNYFFIKKLQKLTYGAGIPTNVRKSLLAKIQIPFFLLLFLLNSIVQSKKSDIIHSHWSLAGIVGILTSKILKKKNVLMMHGADIFVLGKNPFLKFILKNSDYLLCNSRYTEKMALEIYPVKTHKIVSPGVDLHKFYPQIKNLRKKLNIGENDTFILSLAKFIPRKGIEYLIEAMDILVNKKKYSNIYVRLGGRGPLKKRYLNLIKKYNLNRYIKFTGYINKIDIANYYSEADIFVLPSIIDDSGDTEGLGVVLLEANACGTPVIGSRVGGIQDIILDGKNGFFVEQKSASDIANKLIKLINNPKLREEMGRTGKKYVSEKFNWEKNVEDIVKIYNRIL